MDNGKKSNTFLLVFLLLAFAAAAYLAWHFKMQRDQYYNQLNGVTDAKLQTNL